MRDLYRIYLTWGPYLWINFLSLRRTGKSQHFCNMRDVQ